MSAPRLHPLKRFVIRSFDSLGYMSVLFQWLWVAIIYGPLLADSPLRGLFMPTGNPSPSPEPTGFDLSPLTIIVGGMIVLAIIALTIYVIIKTPATVGKVGHKATQTAAKAIVPIITHHQPISKKKRVIITGRIVLILKTLLVIVPVIGVLPAAHSSDVPLEPALFMAIILVNAAGSALLFGGHYLAVWLFRHKIASTHQSQSDRSAR